MANLISVELGSGVAGARTYPVSGVGLGGRTTHRARGEYTITAALALNDTIQLFDLPKGARILGGFIKADDLDSGGTALRISVGDAGSSTRYFSSSSAGSVATSVDATMAATGIDYVTTAKTRVFATVSTGPTTGATTGTIVVSISYNVEEPL
jgi:hypothetical protein